MLKYFKKMDFFLPTSSSAFSKDKENLLLLHCFIRLLYKNFHLNIGKFLT